MNEVDPEMLENLDMLLNMDIVEAEEDWEAITDAPGEDEEETDEEA